MSRDYCFGTVNLVPKEGRSKGQLYPICNDAMSRESREAICVELNCGESDQSLEFVPVSPGTVDSVVALTCPADSKSVASCNPTVEKRECTQGRLKCSGTFSPPGVQG